MIAQAETPAELLEPTIALPQAPQPERPSGFPFMMVLAPIVIALTLFALLRTPYVLMFAIFGPVLGIATTVDQRIGARRRFRRAMADYEIELGFCRHDIAAAQNRARRRANELTPNARAIVFGARPPADGFVIGTTDQVSTLRTSGSHEELSRSARVIPDMPYTVTTTAVRLHGTENALTPVGRALVVAMLAADPSRRLAVTGPELARLRRELQACGLRLASGDDAEVHLTTLPARQTAAESIDLSVEPGGKNAVLQQGNEPRVRLAPVELGEPELRAWLPTAVAAAGERDRLERELPRHCKLADLDQTGPCGTASFLVDRHGAVPVDLISDGPHAVVGGTTGSGKSELLVSWATALCAAHTAHELNLLCLDFKGGATFDIIAALPHCTGVVTDLDGGEAMRVASGLRAEVQRRESALRVAGVRDLVQAPPGSVRLSRLVVFVDEYQALIHAHPDLQHIVADLAARGRSLGIHLVLCTQRATGTFREELLANCAVRLSLRVELATDSNTLLGGPMATDIPRSARGRAYLRVGGGDIAQVQVALTDATTIAAIAQRERRRLRAAGESNPRPIWHPPLPEQLSAARLPAGIGLGFGLCDRPLEQAQTVAELAPGQLLFVIGAAASGKTTALRTIAAAGQRSGCDVVWLPLDPEAAWDGMDRALAHVAAGTRCVVCLDDLDGLEQLFDDDHRTIFLDRLQLLLRGLKRTGGVAAISAQRLAGQLLRVQQLCDRTLRLAHVSRNDWILQGGESADWSASFAPGRGRLERDLVQVALAEPNGALLDTALPRWAPFHLTEQPIAVVTRRPQPMIAALRAAGTAWQQPPTPSQLREPDSLAPAIIGDVEQWIAAFGALGQIATTRAVVLLGITSGEWRSLLRGDGQPPALSNSHDRGLLRHPDGRVQRLRVSGDLPVEVQLPEPVGGVSLAEPARHGRAEHHPPHGGAAAEHLETECREHPLGIGRAHRAGSEQ